VSPCQCGICQQSRRLCPFKTKTGSANTGHHRAGGKSQTGRWGSICKPSIKEEATQKTQRPPRVSGTRAWIQLQPSYRSAAEDTLGQLLSPQDNISLNIKLVQLPAELMDYVILHELAHTRVHNHAASSGRNWINMSKTANPSHGV